MILRRKQQQQCKQVKKSKNKCYNPLKFILFIFLFLFQGPFFTHRGESRNGNYKRHQRNHPSRFVCRPIPSKD